MKRICCNEQCGAIIDENNCLDYKHAIGAKLCPLCHEVTDPFPNDAILIDDSGQRILCERCVTIFGAENAKVATEHKTSSFRQNTYHLCVEHAVEREKIITDITNGRC